MDGMDTREIQYDPTMSGSPTRSSGVYSRFVTMFPSHLEVGEDGCFKFTSDPTWATAWNTAYDTASSTDSYRPQKRLKNDNDVQTVEHWEDGTIKKEVFFPCPDCLFEDEDCVYLGTSRVETETKSSSTVARLHDDEDGLLGGEECAICYEPYMKIEDLSFLQCLHFFHKGCVDKWMAVDTSCPVCRRPAVIEGNLQ